MKYYPKKAYCYTWTLNNPTREELNAFHDYIKRLRGGFSGGFWYIGFGYEHCFDGGTFHLQGMIVAKTLMTFMEIRERFAFLKRAHFQALRTTFDKARSYCYKEHLFFEGWWNNLEVSGYLTNLCNRYKIAERDWLLQRAKQIKVSEPLDEVKQAPKTDPSLLRDYGFGACPHPKTEFEELEEYFESCERAGQHE